MIANLTKKQIRESSAMELACRLTRLQFDEEAGTIALGDLREIRLIEKDLRRRLVKMLGRNFYPPNYSLQHDNTG